MSLGACGECSAPVAEEAESLRRYCTADLTHDIYYEEDYDYEPDDDWYENIGLYERILAKAMEEA